MTDEKIGNELAMIVITDVTEHEDGSATYTFDMDDASAKKITELGIELIITCAAYGLDIQQALEDIRWAGEQRELAKKIDGPYTADDIEKEFGNGTDNT